ncbi:DUF2637 domain-containing protein [Micromonospora sp. Llam7]|uniref:DUF2637 domain-containing protein n=1 Tax=Micromonospora tarapacensis TaxID=2835305 RepID=UPI001C836C8D|nr:DUF2637 domain-containing protein [Micromonospora tarapacensis]MBX7265551.1 DUF2637 domain-containing protein [Micromonospora tarapacensis]
MNSVVTAVPERPRDWWVTLGMAVSATSAAASSFSGLMSLAEVAGWTQFMAPLLPLTVDAYAMTATRVWLSGTATSARAQQFARSNAIGAILLSLAGNATWHLVKADLLDVGWVIVLGVGSVPPVVLGLISHLAVLRRQVDTPDRPQGPSTAVRTEYGPRYDDEAALLEAARAANAAHLAAHGKPITRDALRKTLRVSGQRATDVLRVLRKADPA